MKIPKYIEEALKMRIKAANKFKRYDLIVSQWCIEHNVTSDDICGAIDSIANPEKSAEQVRKDILNT